MFISFMMFVAIKELQKNIRTSYKMLNEPMFSTLKTHIFFVGRNVRYLFRCHTQSHLMKCHLMFETHCSRIVQDSANRVDYVIKMNS